MLEWNTLLIDCSSLEANIFAIDIFDLFRMVLRIIQVQGRSGFQFFDIFLFYQLQYLEIHECLSETLLNRLFLSRGEHFRNWHIWSISDGSQNYSSTRSQRVSILRHLFVLSATISRDPWIPEWNTLLIDCSSQRGEHFWNWHIRSISNGSRNNSSTNSQRGSIHRHLFLYQQQ